jgi:hypothetical protein
MQSSFCLNVGFMRSFWRLKDAKIGTLAIANDAGNKPTRMPDHTKQSSRASTFGHALVFGVRSPTDLAQVGKDIVGFIAVNVVNFLRWPFASRVQPYKLVRHSTEAVKHDIDVPIGTKRSGRHSSFFPSFGLQVSKLPGFGAVMRKLAQAFLCDHVAPHQSGKSSKDAASGDESPVPRQVSCIAILRSGVAKSSNCVKIEPLRKLLPAASNIY